MPTFHILTINSRHFFGVGGQISKIMVSGKNRLSFKRWLPVGVAFLFFSIVCSFPLTIPLLKHIIEESHSDFHDHTAMRDRSGTRSIHRISQSDSSPKMSFWLGEHNSGVEKGTHKPHLETTSKSNLRQHVHKSDGSKGIRQSWWEYDKDYEPIKKLRSRLYKFDDNSAAMPMIEPRGLF